MSSSKRTGLIYTYIYICSITKLLLVFGGRLHFESERATWNVYLIITHLNYEHNICLSITFNYLLVDTQ